MELSDIIKMLDAIEKYYQDMLEEAGELIKKGKKSLWYARFQEKE